MVDGGKRRFFAAVMEGMRVLMGSQLDAVSVTQSERELEDHRIVEVSVDWLCECGYVFVCLFMFVCVCACVCACVYVCMLTRHVLTTS